MDISQMRTLLRRDLKDKDASSYRWTDAELDRHIQRAVRELSLSAPLEQVATLTATGRDVSLSSLDGLVYVEAVEYPVGLYPPCYVPFSIWGDTLTLLVDEEPTAGEQVKVFYGRLHTLDATTSTIPERYEEVVLTGAAGYAALEWSSFATNRLNQGGPEVWRHYQTWGRERLSRFHSALARIGRRSRARARRLYLPARASAGLRGRVE